MVSAKEDIKPGLKVNVSTFHSWAFKFMRGDHGLKMNGKTVNSSGQKQIIENVWMHKKGSGILLKNTIFCRGTIFMD